MATEQHKHQKDLAVVAVFFAAKEMSSTFQATYVKLHIYIHCLAANIQHVFTLALTLTLTHRHTLTEWLTNNRWGHTMCVCVYRSSVQYQFQIMQQQLQFALMNIERCAAAKDTFVWNSTAIKLFEMCMHSRTLSSCIVGNRACINTIHCSICSYAQLIHCCV